MSDPVRWLQLALLSALAYAAFSQFALSQERHLENVTGGQGGRRPALRRALATVLLVASAGVAIWRDGPEFGLLIWFLMAQVAAVLVTFTLAFRPGLLRPLVGR